MKADFEENDIVPEEEAEHEAGELKRLKEKLKTCLAEKQDYLDGWQRARADFANLKKEEAAKRGELRAAVAAEFAEKLIPLADSFEAALRSGADGVPQWRTGLESIHRDFIKTLEEFGITAFDPLNEPFDPSSHVAVGREGEGEVVIRVDRTGYRYGDTVLRPAYVTLGSASDNS